MGSSLSREECRALVAGAIGFFEFGYLVKNDDLAKAFLLESWDAVAASCISLCNQCSVICSFLPQIDVNMCKSCMFGVFRCDGLSTHSHIFMRWKERKFVNVGEDCGLTIAGFYYICISRQTGIIEGFYHDPHSSPYQKLHLKPLRSNCRQGYVSTYVEYR